MDLHDSAYPGPYTAYDEENEPYATSTDGLSKYELITLELYKAVLIGSLSRHEGAIPPEKATDIVINHRKALIKLMEAND